MDPLLIFFREDYLELWSIDSNDRIQPVNYGSTNKIPLYFFLDREEIKIGVFAKNQYYSNTNGAIGNFWKNLGDTTLFYTRFNKKHNYDSLLPYALKENVLPDIIGQHFHGLNYSEFLVQKRTFVLFDSFIDEEQREIIIRGLFEIVGFAPNYLSILDFWDLFRSCHDFKNEAILFLNASLNNIYIHLIGSSFPFHVTKKVIEGRGRDPRLDTILDFIVEKAKARGSMMNPSEIKNLIADEAPIVLNKLPQGFVKYEIVNKNLDINPLKLDFNSIEIEVRLDHKPSLNFIQNEFSEFIKNNNASLLCKYLYGEVITQPVFFNFFKSTYIDVRSDTPESHSKFIEFVLKRCKYELYKNENNIKVSPRINKIKSDIEDILFEAKSAEKRGDFNEALIYYSKVLEIDPDNYIAKNKIKNIESIIHDQNILTTPQNNSSNNIKVSPEINKIKSDIDDFLFEATSAEKKEDYNEALIYYSKVLNIDRTHAKALLKVKELEKKIKSEKLKNKKSNSDKFNISDEAKRRNKAKNTINVSEGNNRKFIEKDYLFTALDYEKENKFKEALEFYKKVLEINPNNTNAKAKVIALEKKNEIKDSSNNQSKQNKRDVAITSSINKKSNERNDNVENPKTKTKDLNW